MYVVYTDGSELKNSDPLGNPGGYGVRVEFKGQVVEWGVGYYRTTNNRMEIMAIIAFLEELQESTVCTIHTDSQYTIDAVTKWIYGWKRNNWMTGAGIPVKNKDLLQRLHKLMKFHKVTLVKVKGHSGIPGNEAADKLAGEAAKNPTMIDEGFIPASQQPRAPAGYRPYYRR